MSCKNEIRQAMIQRRKAEGKGENGIKIADRIRSLPEYIKAKAVMVYMPVMNEADVTAVLADDKVFVVPVTEGEDMYACPVGEMEEGAFKVPVPKTKAVFDKTKIDIVIVPGVAFDKNFNRMGFGKGYYDRFLDGIGALKIGVCHAFQFVEDIPSEPHDIKMDLIVTEDKVWRRGSI